MSDGAMPGALDGIRILDLTWGTAALGVLMLRGGRWSGSAA